VGFSLLTWIEQVLQNDDKGSYNRTQCVRV
jgi:hypothetical protein